MRTVTFSEPKVKSLTRAFECTWVSRQPNFHSCDLDQEKRIFLTASDIYATGNFCTFWCTPELEVLHYASGHYSPAFFADEIKFVNELAAEVLDEGLHLKKDLASIEAYRRLHKARADKHEADARVVQKAKNGEKNQQNGDWDNDKENRSAKADLAQRRENLVNGLNYLARVSNSLAKISEKKNTPVLLPNVISTYLDGDPFGEGKPK